MGNGKSKCILLLGKDNQIFSIAESYCKSLFDTIIVLNSDRKSGKLSEHLLEVTKKHEVDFLFNFMSPKKVSKSVLENIKKYAINFHPACPKYPGVGSASYAIYNQDNNYGVTAHLMTENFDEGRIINVLEFPILKEENCDELFERAIVYSLFQFYEVLLNLSRKRKLKFNGLEWSKKAVTRAEFEDWMFIDDKSTETEAIRKIKALKSNKFPGPFIRKFGTIFQLSN